MGASIVVPISRSNRMLEPQLSSVLHVTLFVGRTKWMREVVRRMLKGACDDDEAEDAVAADAVAVAVAAVVVVTSACKSVDAVMALVRAGVVGVLAGRAGLVGVLEKESEV